MAAWFRRCAKENWRPDQPSNGSGVRSFNGKSYVVLENVNGVLAVYRIKPDGFLKYLHRWPKALEE
jgi:hypothetical protein